MKENWKHRVLWGLEGIYTFVGAWVINGIVIWAVMSVVEPVAKATLSKLLLLGISSLWFLGMFFLTIAYLYTLRGNKYDPETEINERSFMIATITAIIMGIGAPYLLWDEYLSKMKRLVWSVHIISGYLTYFIASALVFAFHVWLLTWYAAIFWRGLLLLLTAIWFAFFLRAFTLLLRDRYTYPKSPHESTGMTIASCLILGIFPPIASLPNPMPKASDFI